MKIGQILKSKFQVSNRQRLFQVVKITPTATFIKLIGDKLATPLRFETEEEINSNFIKY